MKALNDFYHAGWRPGIGWICLIALVVQFVLRPMLPWIAVVIGVQNVPEIQSVNFMDLMTLLGTVLGLGALRTYEKTTDTENK